MKILVIAGFIAIMFGMVALAIGLWGLAFWLWIMDFSKLFFPTKPNDTPAETIKQLEKMSQTAVERRLGMDKKPVNKFVALSPKEQETLIEAIIEMKGGPTTEEIQNQVKSILGNK